jgi:hypothetical protein
MSTRRAVQGSNSRLNVNRIFTPCARVNHVAAVRELFVCAVALSSIGCDTSASPESPNSTDSQSTASTASDGNSQQSTLAGTTTAATSVTTAQPSSTGASTAPSTTGSSIGSTGSESTGPASTNGSGATSAMTSSDGVPDDNTSSAGSSEVLSSDGSSEGDGGAGSGSDESTTGGTVAENATIVPDPGWACGMPDGIPSPTQGELAFTITLNISGNHEVGNTPYGFRRLLEVSGGTITGDRLQGSVLTGGLEYELTLSNGVMEYQSINVLDTSDGGRVFVRSCGVAPDEDGPVRIIPDFEATTTGGSAFLNTGTWVATRELTEGKLKLDVYDVSMVTAGEPRVEIKKPAGDTPQPWECNTTTGQKGAEVLTENVALGASYSINNAKYGSRNIIPITGGTTTGRVTGEILNGGADYQLSGSLDAWYTLAPDNGELILVRNCGASNGLIPWFEAAVDGEFNFLNTQAYLSSAPGVGGGGVSITFYERQ